MDQLQMVIPVYNEGENILKTLEEIERKVTVPHKILMVYDFDQDNTLPVVRDYIKAKNANRICLVKNQYGPGVLRAIKTGLKSAEGEVVLVVMADGSDDLAVVDRMYEKIREGADIVCASRYMRGGRQIGGPPVKKFISRLAGVSLHYLAGIPTHDVTNSFKMYRKSVIDGINVESTGGFEIGMEMVVKAFLKGCKIAEVPSIWRDRAAGKSRFRFFRWLPKYMHWYWYALKGRYLGKKN